MSRFERIIESGPFALAQVLASAALDRVMGLVRLPADLTPTETVTEYRREFRVEAPVPTEAELGEAS